MRSGDTLSGLLSSVDELAGADVVAWADEDVRSALPALLTVFNQLSAVIASVVASFDARDLSAVDGCRTTRAWLVAFGRMSQVAASGWLTRSRVLRELPALAAAAARGDASSEHVAKVADLVHRLDAATVREFDTILAELAATARPADVAKACERIAAHKDPDGKPPDPERYFDRRELMLSRTGSMVAVRGRLDLEGGATLLTALDALMRPPTRSDLRTPAQRRADALVDLARLATSSGALPTVGGVRPSLGVLVTPETLLDFRAASGPQAAGAHASGAHAAGAHAAGPGAARPQPPGPPAPGSDPPGPHPPGPLPGAHRPGPGASRPSRRGSVGRSDPLSAAGIPDLPEPAWLTWAGEIPGAVAQRLACDADIWRVVLDPATGLPLEVGRAHRLVPHWIRKALHTRDRGCRWPGCEAPVSWTDAHHVVPWYLGGRTDIDQLISLCRWHHTRVHEGRWQIRLDPATGAVHVTRPDGRPYELGPSLPYTGPASQRRAA
jgi:hypothetical protein